MNIFHLLTCRSAFTWCNWTIIQSMTLYWLMEANEEIILRSQIICLSLAERYWESYLDTLMTKGFNFIHRTSKNILPVVIKVHNLHEQSKWRYERFDGNNNFTRRATLANFQQKLSCLRIENIQKLSKQKLTKAFSPFKASEAFEMILSQHKVDEIRADKGRDFLKSSRMWKTSLFSYTTFHLLT